MASKPGERKTQILQTLAEMLEQPHAARITTAALAARLEVSEAALYRHFASKAQMFEGLIDFIEQSVFTLVGQLHQRVEAGEMAADAVAPQMVALLLQFGETNPGMTRVMVGDALVYENERLQARMNQFFDKIEAALRQALRDRFLAAGDPAPTAQAAIQSGVMAAFAVGRLQRFVRSGFRLRPTDHLAESLVLLSR